MAIPITIPISFIELLIQYERPNVKAFNDRAGILQSVFEALLPWSPKLDDVEPVTSGKLSEQGLSFRLPLKQVSLFFGPAFCRFSRDNADWGESEETIAIFNAALFSLIAATSIQMGARFVTVGVHLQPKSGTFMAILSPFAPAQLTAIERKAPKTMATVLKWDKRRITIDGSASLANAAFLKFEREFDADQPFPIIAKQILEDERQLFDILGIEEVRS